MKPWFTGPAALLLLFHAPSALAQPSPEVSGAPSQPTPPPAEPTSVAPPAPTAPPAPAAPISSWGTADPPDKPRYPLAVTDTPRRAWYGWQTLIGVASADLLFGAGVLVVATGGKVDGFSPASIIFASTGLAGHVFIGPIIHWVHGNVGRGFLSLGMNLVLPGVGFGLGYLAGAAADRPDVGFIAGGVAGLVAAPAIDIALLAYDDVKAPASARASSDRPRPLRLVPMPIPIYGPDRAGLGVAGVF